jgi:hypothetical protein
MKIIKNKKSFVLLLFLFLNLAFDSQSYTNVDSNMILSENNSKIMPTGALDNATSWSFNLNEYSINDFEQEPFTLKNNTMYNFSLINSGSADFEVCLAINLTSTNYITQESNSDYSDELLQVAGVPMWDDYDTWDDIGFSNQVSNGIEVLSGETKEFLLYLTDPIDSKILNVTWLVTLTGTTDALDNILDIESAEVDLENPFLDVQYSSNDRQISSTIPSESMVVLNISTYNQTDLTKTILNESLSVSDSITMIRWQKDLSGNTIRHTDEFPSQYNNVFVPEFEDLMLDGTNNPGIIINSNLGEVQLSWNFTSNTDSTLTYNTSILESSSVEFEVGKANQAWRVLSLNESEYFDISFGNLNVAELEFWDISVEFYTIGMTNPSIFTLNTYGDNQSETATFFASTINSEFKNSQDTIFPSNFTQMHYWWAEHGIPGQSVSNLGGTHYLGLLINAQTTLASSNLNCEITINVKNISQFDNGSQVDIGSSNGLPFDEFEIFNVREFTFANFTQYEWKLQSNTSLIDLNRRLFCTEIDKYEKDMNNALISNSFSTLTLSGTIKLEFELSYELWNDDLYIYIQNSTDLTEIASFTGSDTIDTYEYDISNSSDSSLQIILNMTSGDKLEKSGPIFDNVRVSNETNTVFFDDFSGNLNDLWTQVDNTDSGLLLWKIQSESHAYNTPTIDIFYPNSINTFVGYSVNPDIYNEFVKTELKYNPFVQMGDKGYIIYKANEDILLQNFSMSVNQTVFTPINLNEIDEIAANHTTSQVVYENYVYSEELQNSSEFYEYYYLDLERNKIYDIEFTCDQSDIVFLYADLFTSDGIGSYENFPNHFGFFVVNVTYQFQFEEPMRMYIKLDAIEPELKINVQVEFGKDKVIQIRNLSIAVGVLGVIASLSLGFILFERKDLILSKIKKSKR